MPVQPCRVGNRPGYKYGKSGKCYPFTAGDEASRKRAHNKAAKQGRAYHANK